MAAMAPVPSRTAKPAAILQRCGGRGGAKVSVKLLLLRYAATDDDDAMLREPMDETEVRSQLLGTQYAAFPPDQPGE